MEMSLLWWPMKKISQRAGLLNLSGKTIEVHRQGYEEEDGIRSRKANLRAHLLCIQ